MASIHAQVAIVIAILMLCSTRVARLIFFVCVHSCANAGKKWNDVNNCGLKGLKCPGQPPKSNTKSTCVDGKCGFACKDGWRDCDNDILAANGTSNGCETNARCDTRNCGQCGTVCLACQGSTARCLNGGQYAFTCNKGYKLQIGNNTCISTRVASCGTGCKSPGPNTDTVCEEGKCKPVCRQGFQNCDADAAGICEVNVKEDVQHCGSCNHSCPQPGHKVTKRRLLSAEDGRDIATCSNGTCGLACGRSGTDDCDGAGANGCEVNLLDDPRNCGACRKSCAELPTTLGATCREGICGYSECMEGFADCDGDAGNGCEVDLRFDDEALCGRCAQVCPGWAHLNQVSSCAWVDPGKCIVEKCVRSEDQVGDCDGDIRNGCEQVTPVRSVENGCSECGCTGQPCTVPENTVSAACKGNVCSYTMCEEGFRDCDTLVSNGCEVNTTVSDWDLTTDYCGACFHDENCTSEDKGCESQCFEAPWIGFCEDPTESEWSKTLCRRRR